MINFKYALSACAAAVLCGCAATGGSKIDTVVIPAGGQQKKLTVMASTPSSQAVRRDQVIDAVISSLRNELGNGPELKYIPSENAIEVAYRRQMGLNRASLVATYVFEIEEGRNTYIATLRCPTVMKTEVLDLSLTGFGGWNKDQIAKNIVASCSNASVTIPFSEEIRDEVNVAYNDVSTFANFRRRLQSGRDAWSVYANETKATSLDIAKSEKFYAPPPYANTLVAIAVYPYRNGSKVVYGFVYRYAMTNTGTTYNASAIKEIKKAIIAVAND